MLSLGLKLDTKEKHSEWENSFTHIHKNYKEKKKKKKKWNCSWEKMSKAIEKN